MEECVVFSVCLGYKHKRDGKNSEKNHQNVLEESY